LGDDDSDQFLNQFGPPFDRLRMIGITDFTAGKAEPIEANSFSGVLCKSKSDNPFTLSLSKGGPNLL